MNDTKPIEAMTNREVGVVLHDMVARGGWNYENIGAAIRQLARPADPTPPQTREEQALVLSRVFYDTFNGPWLAVRDEAAQMFGRRVRVVDLEAMRGALDRAGEGYRNDSSQSFVSHLAAAGFRLHSTSSAPGLAGRLARGDEDATLDGASAAGESPAPDYLAIGLAATHLHWALNAAAADRGDAQKIALGKQVVALHRMVAGAGRGSDGLVFKVVVPALLQQQ